MNRCFMIKSTPEIRVVPKYYLNIPLQLLFHDKLKIFNSYKAKRSASNSGPMLSML